MAFAGNALMGAALFGAVAVAREFGHVTVVPTLLTSPRRMVTMSAQATAVMLGGAVLSIVGALAVLAAIAGGLRFTDYGFMVSAGGVVRVIAASALTGAAGAALGAGIGWLIAIPAGRSRSSSACSSSVPRWWSSSLRTLPPGSPARSPGRSRA